MTQQTARHIDLAVVPHPFAVERIHTQTPAGGTIADIIAAVQPDAVLARFAHVYIDGDYIPHAYWRRVRPKAGTVLTIRMVPMGGGGGKNPLRTIMSIALIAASPLIAGGLAGYLGVTAQTAFLGVSAGRLITAGVNLLGRLALNALAPPGKPRFGAAIKESPTLFIQAARNQAYPFARVPKVLGKHRFVPPLGALPYTETVGNDQYLRMLFVWGYGPLHISDIRIGETPIAEFDDVEIETRQGYDDDAPLTLYSNSVLQNDMEVVLRAEDGHAIRTSDADADEISVDITFPRGLVHFAANGTRVATTVHLEVQYSKAGENNWSASATSFKPVAAQTVSLPALPAPQRYYYSTVPQMRIDRIIIDNSTGKAQCISGTVGTAESAAAPAVPAGFSSLARIERWSNDSAVVPSGRIADERADGVFETAGDFAVSAGAANTVSVAAGGVLFPGILVTGKQSAALRKSVRFKVEKGQYDIRIRRITPDATDDNTFDEAVWTALRVTRYAYPVKMKGVAMTAIRIRASNQLNGVVDRLNGVVHSILPDWDGTAWVDQPTSNPASLYRHVLQGAGNARPLQDNRIHLDRLQDWHARAAAAGREFNAVIDYDVSVREILQDIAAAGRASPTILDGKWAVVEDTPQSVPVQHFTPHNTYGFQGQKAFDDIPQALRVRFINRNKGWMQDERLVFDDGYSESTATKYETLSLTGITDPVQAWKDGRYHIATARLRPETYAFYCDIEHIVCTRGDLVRLTHDVPLFGLASARVKALAYTDDVPAKISGVTLDNAVPMQPQKDYAVRFRKSDGTSLVCTVATESGDHCDIAFTVPLPADCGLAAGNLALFGESGRDSAMMVVRGIEPQGNLGARITCVDAAPDIHTCDTGHIPAFSSQISLPESMMRPPKPVLAGIQSGAEALLRHTDGSLTTRILLSLQPPAFTQPLTVQADIRARDETQFRVADVLSQSATQISLTDVEEGEIYDIRLRYTTAAGISSETLTIAGHRVTGTMDVPSDVENLNLNILGATAYLSWDPVRDIDLSHYTLRFSTARDNAGWSGAIDIVSRIPMDTTTVAVPAASGTYLLKAVDVGGRESAHARMASTGMAALAGYNAVLTIDESAGFSGQRENLLFRDGVLHLAPADGIDAWADFDAQEDVDTGLGNFARCGTYYFDNSIDLGNSYATRLTAALDVTGLDFNNNTDEWDDFDDVADMDQEVDPAAWSVQLHVRTTQDDPQDAPQWSGWSPFVIGDYTARAFEFRAVLATKHRHITPAVSALGISADMADRTARGQGLVSDPDGLRVDFAPAFRATPVVGITAQNMSAGDYYSLTDITAEGFSIRFFNSADTGISRVFDYIAIGYGEKR